MESFFAWIADPSHANAITALATFVICLTGIFYTAYSRLQWKASDEAAHAAKSAADTARDVLELSNRPWIKMSPPRIVSPLTFNVMRNGGPTAIMTVEDTLENVGPGIASSVFSWEDFIPLDSDFGTKSAQARQKQWCDANRHPQSRLSGRVLFPHDPIVQQTVVGTLMTKISDAAASAPFDLKARWDSSW